MLNKCEVCYSENWFKPPMNVKAVTQHFVRNYQYKKERKEKKEKSEKHKNSFSEFLLRLDHVDVPCVLCCSVCLFLYGPFCHGALKLNISILLTTFFIWTSL